MRVSPYIGALIGVLALSPLSVSAHSVVSPAQTQPSKYETFTLGVPVEKEVPTVGMRLLVPEGVDRVTPIVKPGWTIQTKKDEAGNVTEITWTGGSIPVGQKDMFLFSARTTSTPTTLAWKAYQTYRGGEVVAWDQTPSGGHNDHASVDHPYSTTEISLDATENTPSQAPSNTLSVVALVLSVVALTLSLRKKSA